MFYNPKQGLKIFECICLSLVFETLAFSLIRKNIVTGNMIFSRNLPNLVIAKYILSRKFVLAKTEKIFWKLSRKNQFPTS